ncbi:hypothetical protein J22TS1_43330 [Siminovitchia terrae]|uniref:hypothetical protein n=1 Tax=Siminovitchia terrae TaxID=1914933 RepID=UPI001B159D24|nr:hypothetical protein [Siminovitchia terrae]GIN93282.1 hypothetical protein J22TS1_43330 [Siminovitchia terrae]
MSVIELDKNRPLPGSSNWKAHWTNQAHYWKVIEHFANHSPYGVCRRHDFDLSSARGYVNALFTYGFITEKERDSIVKHYNNMVESKGKKKERGA